MESRISQALSSLFTKHRIVFWYDAKNELKDEYDAVSLAEVEKCEITNNAYQLKYRILKEEPEQKFLLYRSGPQPDDLDNWLLDVQLSHTVFRTDQVAIWLADLELGPEFMPLVQEHAGFFHAARRKESLHKLLKSGDTNSAVRLKMLAVCASADARLDAVLENLLQELAENRDEKFRLIERCNLSAFLWEQMDRHFGYQSQEPGLRDFVLELFKSCYAMGLGDNSSLNGDALVFLKRWKDNRNHESSFEQLSHECAGVLNIEQDLAKRDFRALVELDYFDLLDRKIIHDLVNAVMARTVSAGEVSQWTRQRQQGHWFSKYTHYYQAVDVAAGFIHALNEVSLDVQSLSDGVQKYCSSWYRLDQLYRKYIYHTRMSGNATLTSALTETIENLYVNSYLLKLGNSFQEVVDATARWEAAPVLRQDAFYASRVQPYLQKDNKVCVIISDAMRYEVGEELLSLIRREDRYSAELEPALSMLPSYTQLGMAALLPHQELRIADNDTGMVLADGKSTQGTANRTKILQAATSGRAQAIKFEDFMALDRDASRELFKACDVLYVYHNRIDHTGDKLQSEGQAFEAAEHTLDDLLKGVKRLAAANATNILITADHGFIYQHRAIDESDFSSIDSQGESVLYRDRRFILGKGLKPSASLHSFSPDKIGLHGEVEVQIPKSINRLRLKGSGSRFVHGGATLQEVVIPVIRINKKRQSDISAIEVEILRGSSSVITSGQLAVVLYQTSVVTDKIQPRTLRAGIYTQAGELISDSFDLTFDLTSHNPRERELQVRFLLTRKADEANNQEVILKLEEKHAGTTHYKEYKSLRYQMRRSFTSDFDF